MPANLNILHLEDLESDADLVKRQLQKLNREHEVVVVNSKSSYISALKMFSPHIILSDHTLPAFNSLEALKIMRAAGKKIPFILVTGNISEEYTFKMMKEGAYDYILKENLQHLPVAILNAMQRSKLEAERDLILDKLKTNEIKQVLKNRQLVSYNKIVSHDLRTPVTSMMLIADVIDEVKSESERRQLFSTFKNTALNLMQILDVLVDIAKINEAFSEAEPLLFYEVYKRQYNTIEILARQINAEFITDFSKSPSINYPKVYLESIFLNLMSNSLKYFSPERQPLISIKSYRKKNRTFLEYSDNGLGLNMEKFGYKLFGLNQTFHQNTGRKGLGLFMIKSQIESSGGKIRAESKENAGIRFIIEFAE